MLAIQIRRVEIKEDYLVLVYFKKSRRKEERLSVTKLKYIERGKNKMLSEVLSLTARTDKITFFSVG